MPDLGTTPLFYAARPMLGIDGRDDASLREGLMSLLVEESTDGLFRCEATFGNWGATGGEPGFLYFDRQVFDFGRSLTVRCGAGETAAQVFSGRITAIEGRFPALDVPELLILAEDRLQDMRMVRRSRTFEDVADADVFREIAGQHGLAAEIDVDGPTYRVLAQVNQSDLCFLRERAQAIDAELWIDGATLRVQARSRRRTSDVTLTYGKGLHEFRVVADLAQQRTSLAVSGWDVGTKESIDQEGTDRAIQPELDGGESGSRLLADRFGPRAERIVHLVPLSIDEARALAEAHYRRMARRFVRGQACAEGDGRVRVGSRLQLRGLGQMFDGRYYVTRVRHTFDAANGYRIDFDVERAGLGGA
ncbi:MAG TPA: hypothetical protein VES39_11955 [Rhodospirillales bacterium]|nr:hypothetical protein [Rhodospirillales bacterium]